MLKRIRTLISPASQAKHYSYQELVGVGCINKITSMRKYMLCMESDHRIPTAPDKTYAKCEWLGWEPYFKKVRELLKNNGSSP